MVEIVARMRTKYKVRWSYPPETFSLEQRNYMEKWYPALVEEYNSDHPPMVDLTETAGG